MRRTLATALAAGTAAVTMALGAGPAVAHDREPGARSWPRAGRLALRCAPAPGATPVIRCQWRAAERGAVRYELFRKTMGEDGRPQVVFASTERSYDDDDVTPGTRYGYKVRALDRDGRTVARSRVVAVRCCTPRPDPRPGAGARTGPDTGSREEPKAPTAAPVPARLELRCRPAGDGAPSIGCEWSGLPEERVGGYRLFRKAPGGTPTVIARVPAEGPTRHLDRDVRQGATYFYAVEARSRDGRHTARSDVVEVVCCS